MIKIIKKIFLAGISAVMIFSLFGCASENTPPEDDGEYRVEWESLKQISSGWKGAVQLPDGSLVSHCVRPAGILSPQRLVLIKSSDYGETWVDVGVIDREPGGVDFGDGALIYLPDGRLMISYRYNRYNYPEQNKSRHEIRAAVSSDKGKTWKRHSVVAAANGTSPAYNQGGFRGMWSSFLFYTSWGELQCYYDDENVCYEAGLNGNQWFMMKTWNEQKSQWESPVVVARSPHGLSRDGQGQVVEVAGQKLVCAIESVRSAPPHKGTVRMLVSTDRGESWSWEDYEDDRGRKDIYVPEDEEYSTLCPWIVKIDDNDTLLCAFMTDEDRDQPDNPASGVLNQSIKYVLSFDAGETWSAPYMLDEREGLWGPGVLLLEYGEHRGKLFYQCQQRRGGVYTVQKIGEIKGVKK